jgi:hypothetical protein
VAGRRRGGENNNKRGYGGTSAMVRPRRQGTDDGEAGEVRMTIVKVG